MLDYEFNYDTELINHKMYKSQNINYKLDTIAQRLQSQKQQGLSWEDHLSPGI